NESWKLIPHSACPAPTSASGAVGPYGRTRKSTPACRHQRFAAATEKPVWVVLGAQSSASRTVPRGACDEDAPADADAAGEGDPGGTAATAVPDGRRPRGWARGLPRG